ncbi:MAG: hypothetical protein JWL84_566 [Rhodospirillales bacterium]|nr:hypothetical protein [Rhodospirillales bacterium]
MQREAALSFATPASVGEPRWDGVDCGQALTLQRLRSPDELAAIVPEWRRLWLMSPDATPFQSPEWLLPWCETYLEGPLLCWAMRARGDLVGLALFYVYGEAPERRLFLLGTGNSDYLDLLYARELARPIAAATLHCLVTERDRWDCCEWQQMRPGAALLTAAGTGPLRSEILLQETCPVLDLTRPATCDGIWRQAQQYRSRAARQGRLNTVLAGSADFEEIFAALIRFHRRRWNAKGLRSGFDGPGDEVFHRAAARRLLGSGVLRLHALRIDDRITAVLYAFHAHRQTYFYLSGFDPEFAKLSPGTMIVAAAIDHARREGATAFDFMRGSEPYKYRWGAIDRPNSMRRLRLDERLS